MQAILKADKLYLQDAAG